MKCWPTPQFSSVRCGGESLFDDTREKKAGGDAVFLLKISGFMWLARWLLFY
jgi:hypothetical protein